MCLDNDTVGREYSHLLAVELDKLGTKYIVANVAEECKDPNELLVKNSIRLRLNIKNTINNINKGEIKNEKTNIKTNAGWFN